MLVLLANHRHSFRIVLATGAATLVVACLITLQIHGMQVPLVALLGGWQPPLGLALRADGLSAVLILLSALLVPATALFAQADMASTATEARRPLMFWILLLALWCALNIVFVSSDFFNLFVALELLTFSAVPLVCLDGKPRALAAALRYLMFALFGSALYLLGIALLYGAYGVLDIQLLSTLVSDEPVAWCALAIMTAGLLAKSALFPLYLWLPAAHSGAPAAASAVLSALVVKASFVIVLRLWVDVAPEEMASAAAPMLGALGAAAILFASLIAMRQPRLKLMVAYSTLAQLGYLFLVFPLLQGGAWASVAWTGMTLQLVSHAFAKAAMFMAAGLVAQAFGHDRIAAMGGCARSLPIPFLAFALAGLSLVGLPPSGGFSAKWLLLTAAAAQEQWWLAITILVGGILAGGYIFRVVGLAFGGPDAAPRLLQTPRRGPQIVVLGLALVAIALGFLPQAVLDISMIGQSFNDGAVQ
ncbi:NADH-quinone oxidoreductase subunit J [Aureimonas fodinaquatilis]|uniref:NADH-quinone oxidoreductase subunit J n=2 Tax=Aureimonas fodinaquatilis TaxID=2565783 RepID=A0A5B0E5F6_9HYPH|nr:NADH-quinone oxidoreductase subunit J [Aureimonas fodinaquatilis]